MGAKQGQRDEDTKWWCCWKVFHWAIRKINVLSQVLELFEGSHLMTYLAAILHHRLLRLLRPRKQVAICHFIIFCLGTLVLNWIFFMGIFMIHEIQLPVPNGERNKNVEIHRQVEGRRSLIDIHWCLPYTKNAIRRRKN